MTNERRVLVHPDGDALAAAVAARFLTKLVDLLDESDTVNVVLTGGTAGHDVQQAVLASGMRDTIDWTRVHFWWSDEVFAPKADPERNERQAREALLDHLPTPEANIHPFPASDEIDDIDRAADAYADVLRQHAQSGHDVPRFDITFLGVGPDGHIAALFPERDRAGEQQRTVVAVHNAPKPPPDRLTLTMSALNTSRRIWLVLAGAEKASALGLALAGASEDEVPVAGSTGRKRTVFFVDAGAAAKVPQNLIASQY
ncbi:6-phosphogluconolactonase [Amnibacterium sp. CER49]|uniref:6-phosphogluconolactonase n=1 Tax=Amnibacterium sp. CER49 TaxID=3039161 RepID=UPI00244C2E16|nr:6-phosphogluconolactonase [Amnibacterium sp. CER49]MDH2444416.1 6-phosphogluconolactonase [Amnibacterium sp. CER49]